MATKKMKTAPANYFDMMGSVEKDKKLSQREVFGKQSNDKGKVSKVPKGSHKMPDGSVMKDNAMKTKKVSKKKVYK